MQWLAGEHVEVIIRTDEVAFVQGVIDIHPRAKGATHTIDRSIHDAKGREFEATRIGGITFLLSIVPPAKTKT